MAATARFLDTMTGETPLGANDDDRLNVYCNGKSLDGPLLTGLPAVLDDARRAPSTASTV